MEIDKTRILIVDDSVETQNNIKSILQKEENVEIVGVCQNVNEAFEIIKDKSPNLVITEIVLKGEDGFELLEKINTLSKKPKVFVLSAISQESFVEKAMSLGALYYMAKPFNSNVLLKRIKEIDFGLSNNVQNKSKSKQLDEKITNIFRITIYFL